MTTVATKEGSQKNKWMSLDSATCPLPLPLPPRSPKVGTMWRCKHGLLRSRSGGQAEEGGSTSLNEVRHASIKKAARHSP